MCVEGVDVRVYASGERRKNDQRHEHVLQTFYTHPSRNPSSICPYVRKVPSGQHICLAALAR